MDQFNWKFQGQFCLGYAFFTIKIYVYLIYIFAFLILFSFLILHTLAMELFSSRRWRLDRPKQKAVVFMLNRKN